MQKVDIRLTLAENVKRFVNIVNKYNFGMDLRSGRHVVDAKSILGIFSLDLSRGRLTAASSSSAFCRVTRTEMSRSSRMRSRVPLKNPPLRRSDCTLRFEKRGNRS